MKNGPWNLFFDEKAGSFCVTDGIQNYETRPVPGRVTAMEERTGKLSFRYETEENRFSVLVEAVGENAFSVTLRGETNDSMLNECSFPGAFLPQSGDWLLYPYGDGIIWKAEEKPPLPEKLPFYSGNVMSMGMFGLLRADGGLMLGIEETADAELRWRYENGMTENAVVYIGSKGKWAYSRRTMLFLAQDDAFNTLCHAYREWRKEKGFVKTLLEKAERAPRIRKMAGRADVWIFDDNNMNRLYGRPETQEMTKRDVRRIADEMRTLGMDRVLFNSFEGECREDIDYLKAQGMEVGRYDMYRDVIPKPNVSFMLPYRVSRSRHTGTCWPKDVRINENGKYAAAWRLHGTDGKMYEQHSICDVPATRMIMEDVPGFVEDGGYTSWFIDVSMGSTHFECWHPMHPTDRRDSIRYKNIQHQFLLDMGLINGVEVGCEGGAKTYVFSEGMMSPPLFRAPDSGRRMNTLYFGEQIPSQITELDLNPAIRIPLWQMIYHDCTINYWYWGDSSNCCPELMRLRDQFDALYALPPLYSLNMTQWENMKESIAESYQRASGTARLAAFSPMIRFTYLTEDRKVQQTVFENGIRVTVNFGSPEYEAVPVGGCRTVDRDGKVVFEF